MAILSIETDVSSVAFAGGEAHFGWVDLGYLRGGHTHPVSKEIELALLFVRQRFDDSSNAIHDSSRLAEVDLSSSCQFRPF